MPPPPQNCAPIYGPDPDDDIQPHLYSELLERVSLKDDETQIFTFLDSGDCKLKNNSHPGISDAGNRIVFSTRSQAVIPGSDNATELMQIYLRDLSNPSDGRTYLISGESAVGGGALGMKDVGDADSDFARISGDGKWVVWGSGATNLPGNDPGPPQVLDVFMHEVDTATTTRIESQSGAAPNGATFEPFVSSNGRYISFTTRPRTCTVASGPTRSRLRVAPPQPRTDSRASSSTTVVTRTRSRPSLRRSPGSALERAHPVARRVHRPPAETPRSPPTAASWSSSRRRTTSRLRVMGKISRSICAT